jgi:hypothetical protein
MGVGAVATLLVADEVEHRKLSRSSFPDFSKSLSQSNWTKIPRRTLYVVPHICKGLRGDDVLCRFFASHVAFGFSFRVLFICPVHVANFSWHAAKDSGFCRMPPKIAALVLNSSSTPHCIEKRWILSTDCTEIILVPSGALWAVWSQIDVE